MPPRSRTKLPESDTWPIEFPDLGTYFRLSGDTQSACAAVLQLSQGYLSRVVAGRIMPSLELAERIARYARIPITSFARVARKRSAA